jgi:hypothetical protein
MPLVGLVRKGVLECLLSIRGAGQFLQTAPELPALAGSQPLAEQEQVDWGAGHICWYHR